MSFPAGYIVPHSTSRGLVSRRSLLLLSDSFTDHYQLGILRGAYEAASHRRMNLIALAVGVPQQTQPLVSPIARELTHGVIATAPTLAYAIGLGGVRDFCRSLSSAPLCFVGAELEGVPSAVASNRHGIELAVRHLVRHHNYEKIAFLRGPHGNTEADLRHDTFCQTLRELGREPDPELVVEGDFMRHSGTRAMDRLLQRGRPFRALLSSNDMMALGAREALLREGRTIPHDVAIIGFDDMEEGRFVVPPFTSVRQPLEALGHEGVRLALALAEGSETPSRVELGLELIVRESCGCEPELSGLGAIRRAKHSDESQEALKAQRRLLLAEVHRAAQGSLGRLPPDWAELLLDGLVGDLRGMATRTFHRQLQLLLATSRSSHGELEGWQQVLTALRADLSPFFGTDERRLGHLEDQLHRARELVARQMQNQQAETRLEQGHLQRALRESSLALGRVRRIEELAPILLDHLERLGFERAYLAVRADPFTSRLLLAYQRGQLAERVDEAPAFPTSELIPFPLESAGSCLEWVLLPLLHDNEPLGHLLVDRAETDGILWETLRQQVTLALHLCRLSGDPFFAGAAH